MPKSLAPIAGRPFLDYLLTQLGNAGIHEVVLCIGHRGDRIERRYADNAGLGLSIKFSSESTPLGTAGALKNAAPLIQSRTFLLLNGDSLIDADFKRLLGQHYVTDAKITMTLAKIASPLPNGIVTLGADQTIQKLWEKPPKAAAQSPNGTLINAGAYALSRDVLDEIPSAPPAVSFEQHTLPSFIGRGLFGFVSTGFFIDIGVPDDYQRAQLEIPKRNASCAYSHSR